jgi:hypothetical protein
VSFPSFSVTRGVIWVGLVFISAGAAAAPAEAQEQKPQHGAIVPARGDRALIVVGLPGDNEHAASFGELARTYREWLTGPLGFPQSGVRILFGPNGEPSQKAGAATREAMALEASAIREGLAPDGRLWVMVLGHANVRGGHVFLHLPGPDLRDDELAKLFEGINCREQVFWITTAASGGFLRALSAKGRIVITATTADGEVNETEFPHALAEVCRQPIAELDQDADGNVTVWDVFLRLGKLVDARFAADKRTPTEHALLDDNGDQVGTERPDAEDGPVHPVPEKEGRARIADGELAKKTVLPLKIR